MDELTIKTEEEMEIMAEGGERLSEIKEKIRKKIKVGVGAMEIEELTTKLIEKVGGKPSFKMVPGYHWSTCVNVNEGVVHGIPKPEVVFKNGDIVSVDMGLFYKGFHTDTSISVLLGKNRLKEKFLVTGKRALKKAIGITKVGKKVGDIAAVIESEIKGGGYEPVKSLTGHGIGRNLHEDPRVPCRRLGSADERVEIRKGMALAIEVMYCEGSGELELGGDGWTIRTKDGKMAALFEETVALTNKGTEVLTTGD